jgi:UDP-N-acetyl-D-mannosaminuronic acid dehydrogenase
LSPVTGEVSDLRAGSLDVVVVGGCGHVGLPLAISFAAQGLRVAAFDTNAASVERVNTGQMPFDEPGAAQVIAEVVDRTFFATSDPSVIGRADCVVVVIGTPVDEHLNPDPEAVPRAVSDLLDQFVDGQLLVLRSTIYPGVTALVERLIEQRGRHIEVAFCPERIAEGMAMTELRSLPQIVSGRTPMAVKRAEPRRSRAGQALHEYLALHQVCDRQSALYDRERFRRRFRTDQRSTRS